jgi:NTE family protein
MHNKTALVLSGGGMFGSYQAGVWAALQDSIQPDMVIGASIGSLNGWLIAGGCSGVNLEKHWLGLEPASDVKWQFPKRLAEGIINPAVVEELIQNIHKSCSPKMRYALVATAMRTLRPQRFEGPAVTWQHLAASCAIPLFLRQQRIDGILYGDGGVADPLPLWAAVEMGATRIVAVHLLKERPLFLRAAMSAARRVSGHRDGPLDHVSIVEINPSERLGTARDTIYWSKENADRWISLGRRDANRLKQLVVECFERV